MHPPSLRRRVRRFFLASAVVSPWLLAAPPARAWNFDEHAELGSAGYAAACAQLAQDLSLDVEPKPATSGAPGATVDPCVSAKDDATVRWCLACRTFTAAAYGQSVAIAGDHVGSPEELMSPEGQVVAANVVDYTLLALVNVQHFHPAAPRNWRAFHDQALALAVKDHPGGPVALDFAQVFYTSAFADHFLQDSFAAGHAGFNRPSTGAVAAKAFHDIWNQAGRLVKSPTGACWLQYGDGKLKYSSAPARAHLDAAEKASVLDVLAAFISRKRDTAREVRPLYDMPSETTADPLPGPVWGARGGAPPRARADRIAGRASAAPPAKVENPPIIEAMYQRQKTQLARCGAETVPIDGMSNPALINGGVDFYFVGAADAALAYGSFDALYNHRLLSIMSLPVSWEGGLGIGGLSRDGRTGWAPSALLGAFAPPLYLVHGLWRNELGAQATGYLVTTGATQADGYVSPLLRSSLEAATFIVRLQAGPTFDLRTGRTGVVGALGFELSGLRWITGGGALTSF